MFFDALIIALISTTPVEFRNDCEELDVEHEAPAYHRVVEHWQDHTPHIIDSVDSQMNFCLNRNGNKIDTLIHELGHELHHRIKEDDDYDIYVNAWMKLYDMSESDDDYTTLYAQTNEKEDFAETFEEYYRMNKGIPAVEPGDWIDGGVSEIQRTKFRLMEIIIDQASEDADILSK